MNDANRSNPDAVAREATSLGYVKDSIKSKRSVNEGLTNDPVRDTTNDKRHNTRRVVVSRTRSYASSESDANEHSGTTS